ncbi:MAG: hypothetical protein CL472_09295 [Acidobacteria bacterium]|nr:hypothetical protein [Acidobacteriota bacterium]
MENSEENPPAVSTETKQYRAEMCLIGAVMADRSVLAELGEVTRQSFSDPNLADAWHAVVSDKSIDDELALSIVAPNLPDTVATRICAARHSREIILRAKAFVMESRARAVLRDAAERALRELDDRTATASTVSADLMQSLRDSVQSASLTTPASVVAESLRSQKRSEPLSTGIAALDYVSYGGLWPGQLTGLFARYKTGKTTMAATIASNLERNGVPTLMVSLERRKNDIERFIMARALNTDARDLDLEEGGEHSAMLERYLADNRNLHYVHRPAITIDELRAIIISAYHSHGIKALIVDYWQLITNPRSRMSQQEKQQESGQMIADQCSDLDIAGLIMGQLNQEGQPRGGEGILASAGIVHKMHRPGDAEEAFFEPLVCNKGPVRGKGTPADPAVKLVLPGPHFTDFDAV